MLNSVGVDVIVTGGTFDKTYNYITGELYFDKTNVPDMFERGRCSLDLNIRTLMMLDSLDMTTAERQLIVDTCKISTYENILITHGTDTMVITAKMLADTNIENKTIVLTGAIIPYKFGSSDGFFNLGSAVAFAQALPPGVYIAMNGRVFTWDKVFKNRQTGFFEEKV